MPVRSPNPHRARSADVTHSALIYGRATDSGPWRHGHWVRCHPNDSALSSHLPVLRTGQTDVLIPPSCNAHVDDCRGWRKESGYNQPLKDP